MLEGELGDVEFAEEAGEDDLVLLGELLGRGSM